MKTIEKIFLILIIFLAIDVKSLENEAEDYCADAPSGTKEACTNTITFCYGDKEYVGCPYDKTKKIYATSATNNAGTEGTGIYGSKNARAWPFSIIKIDPDIPLERSYIALDSNNRVGFVGCYKGKILRKPTNPEDEEFGPADYVFVKSCSGSNCLGSAYFFKIINANEKTCNPSNDGFALYLATDFHIGGMYENSYYNENMNMYIGKDNWNPTNSGHCPIYLNFNPNVNSKMDPKNRYRLSDDQKIDYDKSLYSAVSNFFNQQYDQNHALTGCTTEDTAGFEEMKQCFEGKTEDIKKFTCPSDESGYDALVTKYDSYQKECKSKYDELYSKKLIDSDSKFYLEMILNAVNEKIDECYAKKCNVDINKIKQATIGTECANGCTESKPDQSESSDASCWMCGIGNDAAYKWRNSTEIQKESTCHPESSVSKTDCYGTVKQRNCYKCLENAYKKANITDEQIKCMQDRDKIKNKINGNITTVSDEHDEDVVEDNANHTYNPITFIVPAPGGGSFGKSANCLAIMGGSDGAAYRIINGAVNIIRILAPIVAIVNAMIVLMPAITAKDETGLKKATKKCVIIGVVLLIIEVFPYVVRLIGAVFGFDLSCIG